MNPDMLKIVLLVFSSLIGIFTLVKVFRNREFNRARVIVGLGSTGPAVEKTIWGTFKYKKFGPSFIVFPIWTASCNISVVDIPIFVKNIGRRKSADVSILIQYPRCFLPDGKVIKHILELGEPETTHEEQLATNGEINVGEKYITIRHDLKGLFAGEGEIIKEYLCIRPDQLLDKELIKYDYSDKGAKSFIETIQNGSYALVPIIVSVLTEVVKSFWPRVYRICVTC
jgi:hypothetical protein